MSQNQTVRLKVNEVNLIGNLKYAFSNKAVVLSELMQNARRAKASKVVFSMVGDTLIVEDDGMGISNMQHLFHVAESGWDAATKFVEKPYGMGWLSCLFSASRVTVESRGKRVEFDVSEAIGFRDIAVTDAANVSLAGTRLMLEGFELSRQEVACKLKENAMGFDIDVIWDGEELPRPYALQSIQTSFTSVGHVSVQGKHFGTPEQFGTDERILMFLQGLPIYGKTSLHSNPSTVVHLDSTRFFGLMPDRDRLHEETASVNAVWDAVKTLIREHVAAKKAEMSEPAWLASYWNTLARVDAFHLTFDVPYLPLGALDLICDEAPVIDHYSNSYLATPTVETLATYLDAEVVVDGCIPKEAFLDKRVQLARLPGVSEDSAFPAAYQVAFANRMLMLEKDLPVAHWASALALSFDPDDYSGDSAVHYVVTPHELTAEGRFSGDWQSGSVQVAKAFHIAFVVNGQTVAEGDAISSFVFTPDAQPEDQPEDMVYCVIDPRCCSHLPRMVEDYCDEWDVYQEREADDEMDLFARYVRSLVNTDSASILLEALQSSKWEIRSTEALHGKSFTVTVNAEGDISVSLQDTVASE